MGYAGPHTGPFQDHHQARWQRNRGFRYRPAKRNGGHFATLLVRLDLYARRLMGARRLLRTMFVKFAPAMSWSLCWALESMWFCQWLSLGPPAERAHEDYR